MILNVEASVSSVGECKVEGGARGGEPNNSLDRELNNSLPLPTPLHHTANITLFTLLTSLISHYTHLNDYHNYVIRHFVLYLADKAGNTTINTQQLNLLSSKNANRKQSKLDNNKTTHDKR